MYIRTHIFTYLSTVIIIVVTDSQLIQTWLCEKSINSIIDSSSSITTDNVLSSKSSVIITEWPLTIERNV